MTRKLLSPLVALYLFLFAFVEISTLVREDAQADSVYKSTDPSGKVVYSSKPKNSTFKPAELPQIAKGEVKLADRELETCHSHGGVNCAWGPDGDGSAICYDGFKGAVTRYRASCTVPKLEVTEVSDLSSEGTFTVFVRNSKSVEAKSPKVIFRPMVGIEYKISGPPSIEPFGGGEFVYIPADPLSRYPRPDAGQLDLTCANCP